jgi:type II secretory pathway pseudopilin PulG
MRIRALLRAPASAWPTAAFTMIEIAISLAVIGFALVAIIAILPLGMDVQKENREETIVNHDASIFMDALRSGSQGADDLTNYVEKITVDGYLCDGVTRAPRNRGQTPDYSWTYTRTNSNTNPQMPLTNGAYIIGLLSTPKYIVSDQVGKSGVHDFYSNRVVALVRSMSGAATEKYPQKNPDVQAFSLTYRMLPEVFPYGFSGPVTNNAWDRDWTNYMRFATNSADYLDRLAYSLYATNLQNNLHDIRFIFRWPAYPNGNVGNQRQVFRTVAGGNLLVSDRLGVISTNIVAPLNGQVLYFLEPHLYTRRTP